MKKFFFMLSVMIISQALPLAVDVSADNRTDLIVREMDRVESGQIEAQELDWMDNLSGQGENRNRRIDQALVRAASGGIKSKNICWADVCALPAKSSVNSRSAAASPSSGLSSSARQPDSFYDRVLDLRRPENALEIGVEWFDYTYREEAFMKLDGSMKGVYADYRHRFGQNKTVQTWKDVWTASNNFNVVMLQTRYSFGDDIKYRSEGTGESFDEKHYTWESRILLGYDVPLRNEFLITPYFGLGYRYLLDDNGGMRSTTGAWSYDRESRYVYLPIGFDVERTFSNQWSLTLNLEYDFFLGGRQKSYFEDVPNSYDNMENKQNSGYGYRGSIKAVKEYDKIDFVFEPFMRYWHIKDSEFEFHTKDGELVPVDDMPGYYWGGVEPKNRTWEFGVRAGVRF
jgi:hypothetical protein